MFSLRLFWHKGNVNGIMRVLKKALLMGISVMMLFSAGCSVNTSARPASGLFISEVVSSNANSLVDPVLGNPDWLELCNSTESPINLLDYTIAESAQNKFVFPEITIDPGQYLVIYFCELADKTATDKICTGFKLDKSGTTLTLSAPKGRVQELKIPSLVTDISYGTDEEGVYKYFTAPTPGAANTTTAFESLEAMQSGEATLEITEVFPKAVSDAEPYAWMEVYNTGKEAVELSRYYVTDNLTDPTKARMPQMQLGAGEYALVKFTGEIGEGQAPLKISNDEACVAIMDSFGTAVDSITWDVNVIPGLSVGRSEDGSIVYYTKPTPQEKNGTDYTTNIGFTEGTGAIRINEILVNNTYSVIDADGDRSPWVELYNASDSPVNLSNYALSDNTDKILKWFLPDYELAPDSYVVIFLSGKDVKTDTEWHTNFKLGSSDRQLILTDLLAGMIQTVPIAEQVGNNISLGFSADGQYLYYPQPTPMAANVTQGFTQINAIDSTGSGGLKINEVATVSAAKSGDPDWVEIFNNTSDDVDLTGYYLSDSRNDLKKWPIAGMQISAGDYGVINKYDNDGESGRLTISLSGETIYLISPQGMVLDQFETGVLRPGLSRGLTSIDTQYVSAVFSAPTPGSKNEGETLSGYCAAPAFSVNGGYQSAPITLEMSTATQGADIYYTLDGSTPTQNATKYTGPVSLSTTQTVRAVAVAPGKLSSDETVATYLFGAKHSLPVVCLSMTESDLNWVFGSTVRKDKRERAGYVEYYEADGTLGIKFPAGFRVAGAGTRTYRQKSINLYLRGGYGMSSVTYPFFGDYDIKTFKSLSLRNMGQDHDSTRLRDAYFHMAVNGMNIDNMQSKFAVVYINGEYWGLYEFKENQNEDYLASKHGIDPDKVEMARNTYAFNGGSSANINKVFSVAKGSTADADRFAAYTELADSEYFMDYLIAVTYFNSSDFYNQKYAHTSDNALKWRPLFYDLDYGFKGDSAGRSIFGSLFNPNGLFVGKIDEFGMQTFVDTGLYYGFYKNREWRDQFVKRYAEVLNTVLTKEKMLALYDGMVASVKDEMPRTIEKWGKPSSMSKWENEVEKLRDCIEERREHAIDNLKSFFDLSDAQIRELFPNG